jgi:hypothetical protein
MLPPTDVQSHYRMISCIYFECDQPPIKVAPKKMNAPLNEEIEGKKNVPINTGQHKMFTIENELNADIGKSLLGNNFDFYFAFMAVYIFN